MKNQICFSLGLSALLALSNLGAPAFAADNLLITEFMAANEAVLADEDGAFPDWVEIFNADSTPVNLDGWFLTDNATRLSKWRFPATNLNAGTYLIVFASGKDRAVPGMPLHTSFNLSAGGEYLALVDPNTNIVSAYAPVFPSQAQDVSFGIVTASDAFPLIGTNAAARVLVPSDGSLGAGWTASGFDDSAWIGGTNGVGFDFRSVQIIADDFNAAHDYSAKNVAGTIWSGAQWGGDTVVNVANAGTTNAGRLTLGSRQGNWENGDNDGMLLYVAGISNDFTAEVEIPASDNPTYHSMGLMARVPDLATAGAGEDWVAAMMFDQFGVGTTMRTTDNGASTTPASGLTHRFLQLQRAGDLFTVLSKAASNDAYTVRATATRADLAGIALQVGVWQATYSPNSGTAQFDNFSLKLGAADSAVTYDSLVRTDLKMAMLGTNAAGLRSSAYLRIPFTVTNAAALGQLTLRMRYDDGFVAYLNGVEVLRRNAPANAEWNSTATSERSKVQGSSPENIDLTAFLSLLQTGANTLALHGLNARTNDADFLLLAELDARNEVTVDPARWRYFTQPSPGAGNSAGVTTLGAVINGHQFMPERPTDADDILITAKIRPTFDVVTNVTLRYRVMFSNEVALAMFDDGAHGDGLAGDGIHAATIPASASSPGQMVRWYVSAMDASGTPSRLPLWEAGLEAPQYFGTVVLNPAITSPLPLFEYFIQDTNWYKLPNNGAYSKEAITNASIYYAGRFYDNVRVRIRGASSVLHKFPKQSLKFDLNPGERFVYSPEREPATQININDFWTDKAYIRNNLSMEQVYRGAGVPAQEVFFLLTYRNGSLQSVAGFVEEPDERFLRRHGLDPNGAFYKMFNAMNEASVHPVVPPGANPDGYGGAEKKTREWEDFSDLQVLVDSIKSSNPNRTTYIFDNMDVPELINYCAASLLIQDWDRFPKNHFVYRDTLGNREWQVLPWDADLSWGINFWFTDEITATHPTFSHPLYGQSNYPGPYGQTHVLFDALYRTPVFLQMYLRRVRTLMDQILQAPGTPTNQLKIEARINELQTLLTTDIDRDKQRWGMPFGTNTTFLQALTIIRTNYLALRRTHLFGTHGPPSGIIPASQFAYPTIHFGAIEYNPSSGGQGQEYIQLTNSHPFAVDLTGWRLDGAVQFNFRPGTVMPSNSVMYLSPDVVAFRARATGPRGGQSLFVQGNYTGQLSARGESLELIDPGGRLVRATNYVGAPSSAQQYLRITEIMYHPAPLAGNTNSAEEFEYIELKNTSASVSLNLAGVRFTNGITFNFEGSSVTSLAPGASTIVVKNPAVFAARYGSVPGVAGQYAGSLENRGERLQLVDASGEEILDFSYNNTWYPITDGLGFSLVIVNESAEPDAWDSKENWRASGQLNGTPGASETAAPVVAPIVINEALTRTENPPPTDSIELFNPTASTVNIGGWFLSDDLNSPKKFRIPDGTTIGAGGFLVFTESQFNPGGTGFALSADGDEIWLFSASAGGDLTGYVHGFRFGPAENGASFGRAVTSDGKEHFVAQMALSPDAPNSGARVGPVIITELMYHPRDSGTNDNASDEFVELQNITTNALPLFDASWPTNTWRVIGGIDFAFPTNVILASGEFVLLANFSPTNTTQLDAFRARYGIAPGVRVFGPYGGKLNNEQDAVELRKPTLLYGTNLAHVLVDSVAYTDASPWPTGADGWGLSLQRRSSLVMGNEPTNWVAAPPGAAAATSVGAVPQILTQPASQTVLAFTPVTLSVIASGAPPLRYQWRHNGNVLPGATNSTLFFAALAPEQTGDYQVAVFNTAGSTVSSNVSLRANIGPVITQQPANQGIRQGLSATLGVAAISASGTPLSYQWRYNGADLPGRTGPSLTITNAQTTNSGIYSVVVTDSIGAISSEPAELIVGILPAIGISPVSQSVPAGGSVTFSVVVTNGTPPLLFQWRFGPTPLTNIVQNSYVSFFTLNNVQPSQAGTYRAVVTNAATTTGVASSTATLTVLADTDHDGMPDVWENAYGFSTNNPADAALDADGDTMSNWAEYIAGTNPTNVLSYLKVERVLPLPALTTIEFVAISNRTYTIEYTDALGSGPWLKLNDVTGRATNRVETVVDSGASGTNRLYRLVTPVQFR